MSLKTFFLLVILSVSTGACAQNKSIDESTTRNSEWTLSNEAWKSKLSEMEFYVLREQGTERAFTGDLWDHKQKGTYVCAGCKLPLFNSKTKFVSGTGWPSFYEPLNDTCIEQERKGDYGYWGIEVHCSRCGGHQGHVFNDGPKPTGLRYCINSVSLDFIPEE